MVLKWSITNIGRDRGEQKAALIPVLYRGVQSVPAFYTLARGLWDHCHLSGLMMISFDLVGVP
jgi:hypothetical protein